MNDVREFHVWKETLTLLAAISASPVEGAEKMQRRRARDRESSKSNSLKDREKLMGWTAKIEILERLSPKAIAIYWCDATLGRYGEQQWSLALARRRSTCVLSGENIKRGDAVYRPWMRGGHPANEGHLILASAVSEAEISRLQSRKRLNKCSLQQL